MTGEVRPLAEIEDLERIAEGLRTNLLAPGNEDLATEFPGALARYTGDLPKVLNNLEEAKATCSPGVREQFIVFAGSNVAGMSIVTRLDETPGVIDPTWPNLTGLVCVPWRRQGLGRLSLQTRLQVVDDRFGGKAWSKVRTSNIASQRMLYSQGLVSVAKIKSGADDHFIYVYDQAAVRKRGIKRPSS